MRRPVHTCGRCGTGIAYVEAPGLPEGYSGGAWEGWFHLDKSREHFMSVGWYALTPAIPTTQRNTDA